MGYAAALLFVAVGGYPATSALTVSILTLLVTAWPNRIDDLRRTLVKGCIFLGFFGGGDRNQLSEIRLQISAVSERSSTTREIEALDGADWDNPGRLADTLSRHS